MTEKTDSTGTENYGLYQFSRKVLLAAIGAAAIAQEEIEHFVRKLVEHGEIAEKDARNLVQDLLDQREKVYEERKAEREKRQASFVTKNEVDALHKQIDELKKQLEEVKKTK